MVLCTFSLHHIIVSVLSFEAIWPSEGDHRLMNRDLYVENKRTLIHKSH